MSQIGGGWTEHFTPEGKPYYHHAATQRTTWDRPQEAARTVPPVIPSQPPSIPSFNPTKSNDSGGSEKKQPVDLLSAIKSGKNLKKVPDAEEKPKSTSNGSAGGGIMGELNSAFTKRGSLKKIPSNNPPVVPQSIPSVPSYKLKPVNGSGGAPPVPSFLPKPKPTFNEPKTSKFSNGYAPNVPSNSPPSVPSFNRPSNAGNSAKVNSATNGTNKEEKSTEKRLEDIERKLNLILKHLGINC